MHEETPLLPDSMKKSNFPKVDNMSSLPSAKYGRALTDPMEKDKKSMPLTNLFAAFIHFVFYLLVVAPFWLFIIMPFVLLTIAWETVYNALPRLISKKKNESGDGQSQTRNNGSEKIVPQSSREFDIVVYGATGFTGKMAALYLTKQYGAGNGWKWAIAGRRPDALEAVKQAATRANPSISPNDISIIIADSSDVQSLIKMCNSTKVVVSTAGPFMIYGSDLVRVCAETGTHYCDITGETDWVRQMIDKYDDVAKKTGAQIVHHCGNDCIPWDLSILIASKEFRAKGEVLVHTSSFDEIRYHASGGTLATFVNSTTNRSRFKASLGFDPLLKTSSGSKSTARFVSKCLGHLSFVPKFNRWCGFFPLSSVNANCVKRSNSVNDYGPSITYEEALAYPNFFAGFVESLSLVVFGSSLKVPLFRWFMFTFILPHPGQGPSEKQMDAGFLKVTTIARSSNDSKVKTIFYFPTDPAYRDTARMLVEAGLVLALEPDKVKSGGGVFTPAACQGEALIDRLVNTGCSFNVEQL